MTWRVRFHWAGRRWAFDGIPVEIAEGGDILRMPATYAPRRFTMRLPLGDIRSLLAESVPIESASCEIVYGDRLLSNAPPTRIRAGNAGHLAEIQVEERPMRGGRTLPPSGDMRVVEFNAAETQRREQLLAEYRAWQLAWLRAPPNAKSSVGFFEGPDGSFLAPPPYPQDYQLYGPFQDSIIKTLTFRTFDTAVYDESVDGVTYPMVFGRPGRDGTPAIKPIPYNETSKSMLVAGHTTKLGTCSLYKRNDTVTDAYVPGAVTTTHSTDLTGRPITVLTGMTGAGTESGELMYNPSGQYGVAFDGTAEGLPGAAPEVITRLVSATPGIRVGVSSLHQLRSILTGWLLDGVVDKTTDSWPVLTRDILPLLPVAIVAGPTGAEFVPIRLDGKASDAQRHITAGRDFNLLEEVYDLRSRSQDLAGRTVVQYSLSALSGKHTKLVQASIATHEHGHTASERSGRVDEHPSPWIYDTATAQAAASHRLLRMSQDWRTLTYAANPRRFGVEGDTPLELGDIVTLTDDALGLTRRPALVTGRRRTTEADQTFSVTLL